VPDAGSYDWIVPVNFTRNGIVRVSDANGQPWQDAALLEYSFKFICGGEGEEPGAVLWFGSSDSKSPSYGFAKVALARGTIQFSGFSKNVETLNGTWHELRVRFDLHHDTGALYLDEKPLFENIPLFTSHDHYFEPYLALQAGAEIPINFRLDDLHINIIRLDAEGNDRELYMVLTDPFDQYDDKSNHVQNCWRLKNSTVKESTMTVEAETGGNKVLRLHSVAGRSILIYLPLDIPARIPFDISDQCFAIENQ
jgi:hypothetical protein